MCVCFLLVADFHSFCPLAFCASSKRTRSVNAAAGAAGAAGAGAAANPNLSYYSSSSLPYSFHLFSLYTLTTAWGKRERGGEERQFIFCYSFNRLFSVQSPRQQQSYLHLSLSSPCDHVYCYTKLTCLVYAYGCVFLPSLPRSSLPLSLPL